MSTPRKEVDKHVLKVVVPQNLGPGSRLIVRAPDGRSIATVVPPGCKGGSTFLVQVPEAQTTTSRNGTKKIQKIKVPPGKQKGDKFQVRLPDGRTVIATVPSNNCTEFYMDVDAKSRQDRQQNWHDNPLAVAPMFLGPLL